MKNNLYRVTLFKDGHTVLPQTEPVPIESLADILATCPEFTTVTTEAYWCGTFDMSITTSKDEFLRLIEEAKARGERSI